MPIEDHPECTHPNATATIWRYMDFTKFVSLLENSALYFCRIDKLSDAFEGYYTNANLRFENISFDKLPNDQSQFFEDEERLKQYQKGLAQVREFSKRERCNFFVNCWYVQEYESAAMWNLYAKNNEGIAIQSTFQRLGDSLSTFHYQIYASLVNYIDYNTDQIPFGNFLNPFMHKRRSYEHEKELRAMIWPADFPEPRSEPLANVLVPVELEKLINHVYVAPTAPVWFRELVGRIVTKYGYDLNITQSDLDTAPLY